jgi:hypothetical protein
MIRERKDVEATGFGPLEDLNETHFWLLVVSGCGRVDVEVHLAPGKIMALGLLG